VRKRGEARLKRSGLNEEFMVFTMAATTREGSVNLRSAEQVSASERAEDQYGKAAASNLSLI